MGEEVNLLVIDDEEGMRLSLKKLLETNGYVVNTAESLEEGLYVLQNRRVDLIICDIVMPSMSGLRLFPRVDKNIPVVIITAYASIETARTAFKLGACDYLEKPFDFNELLIVIRQNLGRRSEVSDYHPPDSVFLESEDPSFQRMMKLADKFGPADSPISIFGESGTGKEIIANYIHSRGRRASFPFLKINCAAIPETLLESELFGYEKGAFTGAASSKAGLLEKANKGSIFLDEIGDMPVSLQAKLLRVLQNYSFTRLGGTKEVTVDCRIIAASNQNLDRLVEEKLFREDLLYRINGFQLSIPPLRERKNDIPGFVDFFLQMFSGKYHKNPLTIERDAFEALKVCEWPGNIRELKNCIERAIVVCEGAAISVSDLPDSVLTRHELTHNDLPRIDSYRNEYMRKLVLSTLMDTHGNKSEAAKRLKVSRRTIYNWLQDMTTKDDR